MAAEVPWARNYGDDPVTKVLLDRGIQIPFHEELHQIANAFIYPPIKSYLGREKSERLGMYHYTVHVRIGIAQEYMTDLKAALTRNFNMEKDPVLVFGKQLNGFFAHLLAAFDNITQEINIIDGLGLDRKSSISRLFEMIHAAEKRMKEGKTVPLDNRLLNVSPVLLDSKTEEGVNEIADYRNYLIHNRIPQSLTTVSATVKMPLARPISEGNQPPSTLGGYGVVSTHSGGMRFPSRDIRGKGAGSDTGAFKATPSKVRWRLPKLDKLDLVPSRTTEADLSPEDITETCSRLYDWTTTFLGKVYEPLIEHYKRLA